MKRTGPLNSLCLMVSLVTFFALGIFALRSFRVKDRTFFNLFASPEETKVPAIEGLFSRYPGRQFILVGDSGEKDPEIYGEIARNHPDQVVRIFIRNTPGSDVSKQRLDQAFRSITPHRWELFISGSELPEKILEDLI